MNSSGTAFQSLAALHEPPQPDETGGKKHEKHDAKERKVEDNGAKVHITADVSDKHTDADRKKCGQDRDKSTDIQ